MKQTKKILNELRAYESRNVTFMESDGSWPIVWERAKGVHVWDVEGRKYLDLTAAFGVAAAGHANPRVVRAGQRQMGKLLHAMGDVHPHPLKAQLARQLSLLTFERWTRSRRVSSTGKVIFCNSGFEAVEAALKTAVLATSKPGVIAFQKGYHGLGYGALNATHRDHFRWPFRSQLSGFGNFVEFPTRPEQLKKVERAICELMRAKEIGAIVIEPIQARGGINVPPPRFLNLLRDLCDEFGALLILDEVYTGFGRTGKWFACEHWNTIPDLICLGKAMSGGFPISACVGRADLMDAAWPVSSGEAIHTSTFLGHPVGCAMALAQIEEIRKQGLVKRSEQLGNYLLKMLRGKIKNPQFEINVRGMGLMVGVDLCLAEGVPATIVSLRIIKEMLHRGFVMLPEGEHANVISFTPPLTITREQLAETVKALQSLLSHEKTS
ncbi:aspartate aminotransferase family protein [Pedosphaera parvula]|uniref:Aminotransferase class-III n=1 Tax=Pedosphaera parvula (strain Ellin514) TaxID=320771 RepID=B9XLJ8_PEDPL|nr:aspartate aminotransferase family protein [Pedosphaera parvula]EEF59246.1 aminotransferase class-III [Pedosphaera parvula Ellin514]